MGVKGGKAQARFLAGTHDIGIDRIDPRHDDQGAVLGHDEHHGLGWAHHGVHRVDLAVDHVAGQGRAHFQPVECFFENPAPLGDRFFSGAA